MPAARQWTDKRIDDMYDLVKANDKRLDAVNDLVNAHERDLKTIVTKGDRRENYRWQLFAITLAALLGSILGNLPHYF